MLDNMANIKLLPRAQGVEWPEFSWETVPGTPASRCFQSFSPYISRLGYTDEGRVYSIICPQQGIWLPGIGALNVEVTVTGQRGWVDEPTRQFAADLTVQPKIWFSPSAKQSPFIQLLWLLFSTSGLPFPASKEHAILLNTYQSGNPGQPIFPARIGETTLFKSPDFARHPTAWAVGNLEVEIGEIVPTGNEVVDEFNHLVMDLFNLGGGNILQTGNVLSWNLWFNEPNLVDQAEWASHAERWRKSIDEDHGSPTGPGSQARYFDGTPFCAEQAAITQGIQDIINWLAGKLTSNALLGPTASAPPLAVSAAL